MQTTTEPMTLRQAITQVRSEAEPFDRAAYRQAERAIVAAGWCPSCIANDNHRVRLRRWQPGNYWEHAGKECPHCEEFFVCGEQPEYEPDPWRGDADSGL